MKRKPADDYHGISKRRQIDSSDRLKREIKARRNRGRYMDVDEKTSLLDLYNKKRIIISSGIEERKNSLPLHEQYAGDESLRYRIGRILGRPR